MRATSTTPSTTHTSWVTKGQAIPAAKRKAPTGGPDQLVGGQEAGLHARVGDAEVGLVDEHRREGARGRVGEHLGHARARRRRPAPRAIETCPVAIEPHSRASTTLRTRVRRPPRPYAGRAGRPALRRTARRAARAGHAAAPPGPRGARRRSARPPAAGLLPWRCRRRCWSSTTTRAASGSVVRDAPG